MTAHMTAGNFFQLVNQFHQCLQHCRRIYLDGAQRVIRESPHLLDMPPQQFLELMDDLHRGVLIKLFVAIAGADALWTRKEEEFAGVLFFHLWQRRMNDLEVREAILHIERQASQLRWEELVRPFRTIAILEENSPELETLIVRTGNLIAKADGRPSTRETNDLKAIQNTVFALLNSDPGQSCTQEEFSRQREAAMEHAAQASEKIQTSFGTAQRSRGQPGKEPAAGTRSADPDQSVQVQKEKVSLETALEELDDLVGMQAVKQEVRTLVNFLDIQRKRELARLAKTRISLHMVFSGNPGTGKTTVARILGKIYGAMGVLQKGHLVETDRSGLVAEFAGQTGPKTNKVIDQALDGVLFIDEAYSLVHQSGEDPFGAEAIQALLKRMEDDRNRLIVILTGYTDEIKTLVRSNPGLASRLGRQIEFADYNPIELAQIFGLMSTHNEYYSRGLTRAKLLVGLEWLYKRRDKHFGNGRMVRNIFEAAIRNLSNRVVESSQFTKRLLSEFHASDIEIPGIPDHLISNSNLSRRRFSACCPQCQAAPKVPANLLGRRVKCTSCKRAYRIEWGSPLPESSSGRAE